MDKEQFPAAVDHSVLYKPYQMIMWFFFLVWAGYVVWTWSAAIQQGTYQVLAFVGALQALLLWYMVNTYTARTEYRLEEDELVIVISRKFKGVKEIHLGYNDIFGVYRMKKENTKAIETAPAYYAYSRLDKREIWVLLYNYNDDTKKAGRILMKASDEFWEAFKEIMPDQICVPQAEVLGYAYKHMGDVLRRKEAEAAEEYEYNDDDEYEYEDDDGEYEYEYEDEADEETKEPDAPEKDSGKDRPASDKSAGSKPAKKK